MSRQSRGGCCVLCVCRQRSGFVSEPAVFVKYRNKGSQVWSMDKFENKLIDMRDIYQERKEKGLPLQVTVSTYLLCTVNSNH